MCDGCVVLCVHVCENRLCRIAALILMVMVLKAQIGTLRVIVHTLVSFSFFVVYTIFFACLLLLSYPCIVCSNKNIFGENKEIYKNDDKKNIENCGVCVCTTCKLTSVFYSRNMIFQWVFRNDLEFIKQYTLWKFPLFGI